MSARRLLPPAIAITLVACGGGSDGGNPPPVPGPPACDNALETPRVFAGLTFASPVAMLQPPNDASRWYVVEQAGRIQVFENDPVAATADVFVDLTARVLNERAKPDCSAWPSTRNLRPTGWCSSTTRNPSAARFAR